MLLYRFWHFFIIFPILLILYLLYKRFKFTSIVNKIPGPFALPFIGNAYQLLKIKDGSDLFKTIMSEGIRLGPIARVWVLNKAQVILGDPPDAEVILKDMRFHAKSDSYKFLHPWMGHGLLTSSDEKWRVHRKVLTPAFHFNILHEFLPTFNKHAIKLNKCLFNEINNNGGFDLFPYISLCALDIICESSMGTPINVQDKHNSDYVHSVVRMNELLTHRYFSPLLHLDFFFHFSPTYREMTKHLKLLNEFADKVISERRFYIKQMKETNGNLPSDCDFGEKRRLAFLDLLLAAEADGMDHMTQKDIRDQVSTVMFEGYDTVTTATSWAIFLIGTYPDVQEKVVEELESIFGDSGRVADMNDLKNLKYLERCIKEALRLYPSVAFFERKATDDAILNKYVIPKGCTITFNGYLLHRNTQYWPDPEKFDPDRFSPENSQGRHPYSYIPFSAGPRNCIGQKYAMLEEKTVLSTVFRRYKVEAAHRREDAELQTGMVLRPINGLKVRIYDREDKPYLRIKED